LSHIITDIADNSTVKTNNSAQYSTENNHSIPPTCFCQTGQSPGEHAKYKVEIA